MRSFFSTRADSKPRFIPLWLRFFLINAVLLTLILSVLAVAITIQQIHFFQEEARQRGLAIAKSLEAACLEDLLTYNHTALEQKANQTAANDALAYIIIHNKEGVVEGYSNRPDLGHKFLLDPISQRALAASQELFQRTQINAIPVLDIAEPVLLPGDSTRWGTIRVGVLLSAMHNQIFNTRVTIAGFGLAALGLGAFASILLARRVTRPLSNLVDATADAAKGKLDTSRLVASHDEIEQLASRFFATVNEIVSKKEALAQSLEEIQTLERYRESLLRVMSDGLISVTTTGDIVHHNPAAEAIFKHAGHPIAPGMNLSQARSSNALFSHITNIIAGQQFSGPREIIISSTTKEIHLLVNHAVLHDDTFSLPREYIISISNITMLRQLEADMRQAKRLSELGTLAAGIVHEIRNPLTVIDSYVQLFPLKIDKPAFRKKLLNTVPSQLKRITDLMNELLQLSRPVALTPTPTDPVRFIQTQLNQIAPYLEQHNITQRLYINEKTTIPDVFIDNTHLSRAFVNIVKNAVEAMPTGGHIDIRIHWEHDDAIAIYIKDSGPGIAESVLNDIFTPFKTGKTTGTGLGLSLAHKIITEHRGQIKAENTPDSGAQFIISLPVVLV